MSYLAIVFACALTGFVGMLFGSYITRDHFYKFVMPDLVDSMIEAMKSGGDSK